jgi:hypothetical protein
MEASANAFLTDTSIASAFLGVYKDVSGPYPNPVLTSAISS